MHKIICANTCTVPGRGLVSEGEGITVPDLDMKARPFLKHFVKADGSPIKAEAVVAAVPTVPADAFPKHLGGGYFELSDGSKVQGKEAAIEAEKALAASA